MSSVQTAAAPAPRSALRLSVVLLDLITGIGLCALQHRKLFQLPNFQQRIVSMLSRLDMNKSVPSEVLHLPISGINGGRTVLNIRTGVENADGYRALRRQLQTRQYTVAPVRTNSEGCCDVSIDTQEQHTCGPLQHLKTVVGLGKISLRHSLLLHPPETQRHNRAYHLEHSFPVEAKALQPPGKSS
jgi:hypothetical protein